MNIYDYSEADEVAGAMQGARPPGSGSLTWAEATHIVTAQMGTPADVGRQIHDNCTEALVNASRQGDANG